MLVAWSVVRGRISIEEIIVSPGRVRNRTFPCLWWCGGFVCRRLKLFASDRFGDGRRKHWLRPRVVLDQYRYVSRFDHGRMIYIVNERDWGPHDISHDETELSRCQTRYLSNITMTCYK